MKIAVCTPRCGPPSWHYHDSMVVWQIYHYGKHPDIGTIHMHPSRELPIDVARTLLVEQFLKTSADYMWLLDQDAKWLPETLDRLLSRDLPIVGALEMMRLPQCPYPMALAEQNATGAFRVQAAEIYRFIGQYHDCTSNEPAILDPPPEGSLLMTGFTGCHCLLIRRDVLEQMESPWFKGYAPGGEDQYFCAKAAALGIPTHVDLSVLVGHATTDRVVGAFDFMAGYHFLDALDESKVQGDGELVEWHDEDA
ncbi:MAG TPA: hypothetical protein VNA25_30850 [Phycisphaerae bacterium]|nr:hypothetical protein [Phycisphaerae bacterium]